MSTDAILNQSEPNVFLTAHATKVNRTEPNWTKLNRTAPASEMTYIVSSGALNSTHSLNRTANVFGLSKSRL